MSIVTLTTDFGAQDFYAGALKGALLAIPDHILLRFRYEHGALDPFREWPAELAADYEPVKEGLQLLAELHRMRNERPVAETVYKLLENMPMPWEQVLYQPRHGCHLVRQ